MLSKIILATNNSDYSESIFLFALDIAHSFSSEIKAIFVVNQIIQNEIFYSMSDYTFNEFIPSYFPIEELNKKIEEEGKNLLDKLDSIPESKNIIINKQVLYGFVDEIIFKESKYADMVIIGRHSHSERKLLGFLGSNTERIMSRIEKPLFIVPKNFTNIKRILVCYDGSPRAKIGLSLGAEYARKKNGELTIFSVRENGDFNIELLQKEAIDSLTEKNIEIKTKNATGEPAKQILSEAVPEKYDLIIMGAHGHRKIKEFFIGTSSYEVARKTSCPIILAR